MDYIRTKEHASWQPHGTRYRCLPSRGLLSACHEYHRPAAVFSSTSILGSVGNGPTRFAPVSELLLDYRSRAASRFQTRLSHTPPSPAFFFFFKKFFYSYFFFL